MKELHGWRVSGGGGRRGLNGCCRRRRGVCSCGCAPSLARARTISSAPAGRPGGPTIVRVCVSWWTSRRRRGLSLARAPSLARALGPF